MPVRCRDLSAVNARGYSGTTTQAKACGYNGEAGSGPEDCGAWYIGARRRNRGRLGRVPVLQETICASQKRSYNRKRPALGNSEHVSRAGRDHNGGAENGRDAAHPYR
jgi:hypothetical protein